MKNTPLTEKHIALGAKMAEFAGYNMPIVYSSIQEEHQCVRNGIGVFDVSHMGEFIVRGKEALLLVQQVTSNDASRLKIGDAQYSCLPNEHGGIIDDLIVYRLPEDKCAEGEQAFMLVVNASNIEKDWNWISSHNQFDTKLINISDQSGLLAVQGPKAIEAMQPLTEVNLAELQFYTFTKGRFAGIDNVLISATGYTGSGGFELYVDNQHLIQLWDSVLQAGKPFGIHPIGLGARDTLRLEMGYCLYGNDIDDATSPLEAGLGWITKLQKGTFVGSRQIMHKKEKGIQRKLVGIRVDGRRVPRHGYLLENQSGDPIGIVTSGTLSPSLGYPIGMGYVDLAYAQPESELFIVMGSKKIPATVTKLPFYTP